MITNRKVVKVTSEEIVFDDGSTLSSFHDQDCCERHSLTLSDVKVDDFDGLEFDLSGDVFFRKVEGYGIELIPVHGHVVRVPAHGWNNGYYGTNLALVIKTPTVEKRYDITECQSIKD
jgi:hypothetical protein